MLAQKHFVPMKSLWKYMKPSSWPVYYQRAAHDSCAFSTAKPFPSTVTAAGAAPHTANDDYYEIFLDGSKRVNRKVTPSIDSDCRPGEDGKNGKLTKGLVFSDEALYLIEDGKTTSKTVASDNSDSNFLPLTPRDKPLTLYRPDRLAVSDLLTPYCELEKFYKMEGYLKERYSEAAALGNLIHDELERKVNVGIERVTPPEGSTKEQVFATKLVGLCSRLELFAKTGHVREIYVFGVVDDIPITGWIDEMILTDGLVHLIDTKTRKSKSLPGITSQLQAFQQLCLYHKLASNFAGLDLDHFFKLMKLDSKAPLVGPVGDLIIDDTKPIDQYTEKEGFMGQSEMERFNVMFNGMTLYEWAVTAQRYFKSMEFTSKLMVEYQKSSARALTRNQNLFTGTHADQSTDKTVEFKQDVFATLEFCYDEDVFTQLFGHSMGFWKARRAPLGISQENISMCRNCDAQTRCKWFANIKF